MFPKIHLNEKLVTSTEYTRKDKIQHIYGSVFMRHHCRIQMGHLYITLLQRKTKTMQSAASGLLILHLFSPLSPLVIRFSGD